MQDIHLCSISQFIVALDRHRKLLVDATEEDLRSHQWLADYWADVRKKGYGSEPPGKTRQIEQECSRDASLLHAAAIRDVADMPVALQRRWETRLDHFLKLHTKLCDNAVHSVGNREPMNHDLVAELDTGCKHAWLELKAIGDQLDGDKDEAADTNVELLQFAAAELKGKQRKLIEILCTHGGELALADLAAKQDWNAPFDDQFNSMKKTVNLRIKHLGFRIIRFDSTAKLEQLPQKQK